MKQLAVAAFVAICLSVSAYSCAIYNVEQERQETARMGICIQGGGKWTTAWNWRTYCRQKD